MTPARTAAVLAGQTAVAKKVYAALPCGQNESFTPMDIAVAIKTGTGASVDIHVMRGCLNTLKEAGLIREVVPGSFRRAEAKEKEKVSIQKSIESAPIVAVQPARSCDDSPIEVLSGLAGQLRCFMAGLGKLADDIDAAAISIEERAGQNEKELAKVKQIATLLKELG